MLKYRLYPTRRQIARLDEPLVLCQELYSAESRAGREVLVEGARRWRFCSGFMRTCATGRIVVEALNVKELASGRRARSVYDAGWGGFLVKAAYKAEGAGRIFRNRNPAGTSQTCVCGHAVPKTLQERWHHFPRCGLSLPRDHVSALVILGSDGAVGRQAPDVIGVSPRSLAFGSRH